MYRQICQNSYSRAWCEVIFLVSRKLLAVFHSHERLATNFHESKIYIYRVSRRKNGILYLDVFVSFNEKVKAVLK